MRNKIIRYTRHRYLLVTITVIMVALFIGDHINYKFNMNDFKVMYGAADAYLKGERIYGTPFGLSTGYFKYSPFTLLYFIPFTLFSFYTASIIHYISIGIATYLTMLILEKILSKEFSINNTPAFSGLLFIFLTILIHVQREIHLGNINVLIILLLSLSVYLSLLKNYKLVGILLALVIFAKPYFIICLLPFILFRKFKVIYSVMVSGITFMLISLLFFGFEKGFTLYLNWFEAMISHNTYLSSSNTIISILSSISGTDISHQYSFPILILLSIIVYLFLEWKVKLDKNPKSDTIRNKRIFMLYFFLSMAVIPNILITDTEHFLFSLPIIAFIILYGIDNFNLTQKISLIIICILFGCNASDLIGMDLSKLIHRFGILGIGNLLFIAFTISILNKAVHLPTNS